MRHGFLLTLLLLPGLVFGFELKIATLFPDGTETVDMLKKAGEQIEKETENRVSLRVFPGGTMGDDRAVKRRIRIGQIHGTLAQMSAVSDVNRDAQVLALPLFFRSLEEVGYVRQELDPIIREGFRNNNWEVFGPIDGGFAYVMSNQPVNTVKELGQQKIWLPSNDPASAKAARIFDVSPVELNIGSVMTSLQTGLINAYIAPPVASLTLQWHSQVQYLTNVPLIYTYGVLAIDQRHFERISDEDRARVRRILGNSIAKADERERRNNQKALQALLNQDIQVVTPSEEDMSQWRNYAQRLIDSWVEDGEVSPEIVDRAQRRLRDYRTKSAP